MDTVTEARLAIAMAQAGGIGVIHQNLSPAAQAAEVRKVKRYESGMVVDPITIFPDETLADALALMACQRHFRHSGRRARQRMAARAGSSAFSPIATCVSPQDQRQPVAELMTKKLVTVREGVGQEEAQRLLHEHRIEKLLVVDEDYHCVGLVTVKDIEKATLHPNACKDAEGRLRVAAASTVGDHGFERALQLIDAGVDCVVIDTAHGHSQAVIDQVDAGQEARPTRSRSSPAISPPPKRAKALIDAGADAIKVGIGPGSICTTRIVAGVGVPQLTAIMEAADEARKADVPVIGDGGVKYSGDLAKAIAAGADVVMIGSLFAGTEESPGEVFLYQGRSFKAYRGMGSVGAMTAGLGDALFPGRREGPAQTRARGHRRAGALSRPDRADPLPARGRTARGHGLCRRADDQGVPGARAIRAHHQRRTAREPCA